MPVRVLLVEDNEVYRASLELLLGMQTGIEVVGSVATGDDAVDRLVETQPDVVLLDYRLPGIDGAEAARRILVAAPATTVVCLTAEASPEERETMLEAGASALVEKGDPIDSIVAVIVGASPPDRR